MRSRLPALLVLAPCLFLVGCSGGWGSASGTVTLDGTDLAEGSITFTPVGPGPTAYGQVSGGSFTVSTGQKTGLPTGKYKVSIARMTIPKPGSKETAKYLTPEKYSKPETSGLEADVKSGRNRFTFAMVSKP